MADPQHIKLVRKGSTAVNAWKLEQKSGSLSLDLQGADLNRIDLTDADLSEANLSRARLSYAILRGVDLNKANLSWAELVQADLSGANLSRADLTGAAFGDRELSALGIFPAKLIGANLQDAILVAADMQGVDLRTAHLKGANLRGTDLTGADLRGADLAEVIYDNTTIWPKGFRPGMFVVKKLVVALDAETPELIDNTVSTTDQASFSKNHLLQQKAELQEKYDMLSKRIAALDTDIGRALDSLSKQVLEEHRKEFAAQREETAVQMALIEEQLCDR